MESSKGFTLVEIVVAVAILAILATGVCQFFVTVINGIIYYREKSTVSSLADRYLEIARNLPYSQVGTINGNPPGNLPDQPNALSVNFGGNNYQIYYVVNYVDDPADGTALLGTDPAPDDYKQIKLYVKNVASGATNSFLTNIAPKGLENLASGGALSIQVFNAVGQPVPNVTIHITNKNISPAINLTRTTDSSGDWVEVGLPDSANSYHIVATKSGYSTDSTYPITSQNQSPAKPDATIANGQVTQVSFSIDKTSNLTLSAMSQYCSPLPGAGLEVTGAKIIGTPNILKFDNKYTADSGGNVYLQNIEWDDYSATATDSSYMLYGSSPIFPAVVLPGTNQTYNLILGPKTSNSLLIEAEDSSNGNPIQGAEVDLTSAIGGTTAKFTAGSIWSQQDWSGGSAQKDFINSNQYYSDNGNISYNGTPSGIRLMKNGSSYVLYGSLVSSSFDTGTNQTVYTNLIWQPTSQNPSTNIKFQIATNNDDATWNFLGPDGTSNTYYTTSGTAISSVNNNNRYMRYEVFLSTADTSVTPVLSNVGINYISGCSTPGQVMFAGLVSNSNNYQATISMQGYQTQTINNITASGNNILKVLLSH